MSDFVQNALQRELDRMLDQLKTAGFTVKVDAIDDALCVVPLQTDPARLLPAPEREITEQIKKIRAKEVEFATERAKRRYTRRNSAAKIAVPPVRSKGKKICSKCGREQLRLRKSGKCRTCDPIRLKSDGVAKKLGMTPKPKPEAKPEKKETGYSPEPLRDCKTPGCPRPAQMNFKYCVQCQEAMTE